MKRSLLTLMTMPFLFMGCTNTTPEDNNLKQQDMSHIIHKNPETLFDPTPYAFSHSTGTTVPGSYVFISGQSGGEDLEHKLSDDFRTQVHYALLNLKSVLDEYHLEPEDVLKITVLIVGHDQEKLQTWTEEMQKVWKTKKFPASTLIPVPGLALDGMLIEMDAIAFRSE